MNTPSDKAHALPAHLDGQSPAWTRWRDRRLRLQAQTRHAPIALDGAAQATATQLAQLCEQVLQHGYGYFHFDASDDAMQRESLLRLLGQLQLHTHDEGVIRADDGLSLLRDHGDDERARFVPYSNRHLNWHTDGYYNAPGQSLRCFVLHCLQPAAEGGELVLLDPELLLIELYQRDAELVALLSHPQCLCLPANSDSHGHSRPDRYAAVFATHPDGALAMRYTTRSRNIRFRNDATQQAMRELQSAIDDASHHQVQLRLAAGQGMLCRNLLHCRSRFSDPRGAPGRQILRGRFTTLPHNPRGQ